MGRGREQHPDADHRRELALSGIYGDDVPVERRRLVASSGVTIRDTLGARAANDTKNGLWMISVPATASEALGIALVQLRAAKC